MVGVLNIKSPSPPNTFALVLVALSITFTSGAEVLHRLPPVNPADVPANLARRFLGAEVVSAQAEDRAIPLSPYTPSTLFTDANTQLTALLSDDPTIGSQIVQGRSEIVIRLHKLHDVNKVTFISEGGSGRVSIHGCEGEDAMRNNQWVALGYSLIDEGRESVVVQFGAASARYIRLSFEAVAPIKLYNFGIFGLATLDDYRLVNFGTHGTAFAGSSTPGGMPEFPLGNHGKHDFSHLSVAAGTNLIYRSPSAGNGSFSNNSNASTSLNFRDNAGANVLIYELPSWVPPLDYVAISYAAPASQRIQLYSIERLPEEENWLGNRTLDTSFLNELEPNLEIVDADRVGRFAVELAPVHTRYLAIRISPLQASASSLLSTLLPLASVSNPSETMIIEVAAFSFEMDSAKSAKGSVPAIGFVENTAPSGPIYPRADFSSNLFDGRAIFRGLGLPRDGLFLEGLPDALQIVSP
jgi:hypothetical protein